MGTLAAFRGSVYDCLLRRADVLFELGDALLCTDGPVDSLVGLSLAAEHRRGQGALYDAVNAGRIDIADAGVDRTADPRPAGRRPAHRSARPNT
jgi:hypothetical protein